MTTQNFNAFWQLDIPWFESPNENRGGWSGVQSYQHPTFGHVFIKKQEDYTKRTLRHPLSGILTVAYEQQNIERLHRMHIPTLEIKFFEQTSQAGKRQGVLVTQALDGYLPLDEYLKQHCPIPYKALADKVASLLASLHEKRWAHCAMYPKHIFVRSEDLDLKFIDLEKMRFKPLKFLATMHDLNKLNRHLDDLPNKVRLYFLKSYLKKMNQLGRYALYKNILRKKSRR